MRPLGNTGEILRWDITADEVAPPTPALIVPILTYADFNDAYATYAEFNAAYASYLEASRDYSLIEG